MSAGLTYLQKQRKSELTEIAETANLPDYAGLKKADLEIALDEHLRHNKTSLSKEASLSEYYKRLSSTSRSPVKKAVEKVTEMVKSDDDEDAAPAKKPRRKTRSPEDLMEEATASASAMIKSAPKEVMRRASILARQVDMPIPASPSEVTDVIEQQSRRLRAQITEAYDATPIHEYSDLARDTLSSPLAINTIALLVEAYCLRGLILPNKVLFEVSPIPLLTRSNTGVYVPDLFLLLNTSFWSPFTLWLLTSLVLPSMVSYFINLPLKKHPTHNYATRRATKQASHEMQFDPFVFNIAKALVCYLVYGMHLTLGGVFTHYTVATVNEALLGGWGGMVTSAAVGAAISLYDAVLHPKH